ncbi:MAG: hypothetical protein E3J52_10890 [Promethearchaeota archaeon]|nr:MAG: hypothetical protein E3J52_10890 [Candidatus Lokiarchaeota archaeon]
MTELNYLELLKQCLTHVHSELMTSTLKSLFLSNIKQSYKIIFPNIYDFMEAEMHNIDSRLMISLVILIQGLLFELQGHLEEKQYEDLKEVLDRWYVPRKFG